MHSINNLREFKDVWHKSRENSSHSDQPFFDAVNRYSETLGSFLRRKTCGSFLSGFGHYEGRNDFDSFVITMEDAAHYLYAQGKLTAAENLLSDIYILKYEDFCNDNSFKYVKRVNFEISSLCNLNCKYCTFQSGKRKPFIDIDLFRKILSEIAFYHPRLETLALYMSGESLLHPGFVDLLEIINKIKANSLDFSPEIYLHTNGTLWTPEMNDKILSTRVLDRVVWSIDGIDNTSFENMRGNKGIYETVLSNFSYFLHNRPYPVRAFVNNLREPHLLGKPCKDDRLQQLLKNADMTLIYPPRDLNAQALTDSAYIGRSNAFCHYIFHTVVVTTDGRMSLCCADYNSENAFGDLNSNSFYDVYYGEKRSQILANMYKNCRSSVPGCRDCSLLHPDWFRNSELSGMIEDEHDFRVKKHIHAKWKELLSKYNKNKIAIFGAGKHTLFLTNILYQKDHSVIGAIIDDYRSPYSCLFGLKPQHTSEIDSNDYDAVILSTKCSQEKMRNRCREIFGPEVDLIDFYVNL